MNSRWMWNIRQLTQRLWFKAVIHGIAAIAIALVAILVAPFVPEELASIVGQDSLESILKILASSMLTVATFSLGTLVAVFAVAASAATPRAARLLANDPLSQNVLSTFIGAFIFSLVSLIALSTGVYGPGGRLVLFAVTVLTITLVLLTFFRWIDYLSSLGQLKNTLDKVELATFNAIKERAQNPFLGGIQQEPAPSTAIAHLGKANGYIQHLDMEALQQAAEKVEGHIWVARISGHWTDEVTPLFWTSWQPDEKALAIIYKAFLVSKTRSFDQDPRFGIIVLSEIASRALSPGINDPGTAIDVIGRIARVLFAWGSTSADSAAPKFSRVFVPGITPHDIFDDAFGPITRDGAGTLEVGIRLQKSFASLAGLNPKLFTQPAIKHSRIALQLSEDASLLEEQKKILRQLAFQFNHPSEPASECPELTP